MEYRSVDITKVINEICFEKTQNKLFFLSNAVDKKVKKRKNIVFYILSFKWLFLAFVFFYKKAISPFLPHVCKYYPSCSQYMVDSINEHSVFFGILFGINRLFRCNPFSKGGIDFVPYNKKGDIKWLF